MTAYEFAQIAKAVAWPLTAIVFLIVLHKPLRAVLERLATTLSLKNVKLKAFGAEVELTPEQAQTALDELLQEIVDPVNELAGEDYMLFERILRAGGRATVADLIPGFTRASPQHQQLQRLRDHQLIRPFEGSKWQPEKHPIATRFGELVHELKKRRKTAPPYASTA